MKRLARFTAMLMLMLPGYLLARQDARDYRVDEREAVALLKQGIWNRELRVDLFQPVLMDKPPTA